MAATMDFDELVEKRLYDVALAGAKGISAVELGRAVRSFSASKTDDIVRPSEDDNLLFSDAPPDSPIDADTELVATVWAWITNRSDIQVKDVEERDVGGKGDSNGEGSSSRTVQRIFTDEERVWRAITGHGVDHTKIPRKNFECLEVIAAHGADGILQPELRRITGQDKRSVPSRTDMLAEKGYILKDYVLGGGSKTSLLKLRKFADEHAQAGPQHARAYPKPSRNSGPPIVSYGDWYNEIIRMLRANGNIIAFADLRLGLGIHKNRWASRALARCVKRLTENGLIRKLKAKIKDDETVSIDDDDDTTVANWVRSLQLMREPTELDRTAFMRSLRESEKSSKKETVQPRQDEDADVEHEDEEEAAPHKRVTAAWTPDFPYTNLIFKIVDAAGPAGISSMDLMARSMGMLWRRPLDEILMRLTDIWKSSQPSHLRHLSIVKDVSVQGKLNHFLYRSYGNFQKAVEQGTASWESLAAHEIGDMKKKNGRPLPKKKLKPPPPVELDEWGFPKIDPKAFADREGVASLSDSQALAQKEELQTAGCLGSWPMGPRREWGGKGNFAGNAADRPRGPPSLTPARKLQGFEEAARKDYEEAVPKRARNMLRAEMSRARKRRANDAEPGDHIPSAKASPNAESAPLDIDEALPADRLHEIEADLLTLENPGVYINPPDAKMAKYGDRRPYGRPKNSTVVVFKSARLSGLPGFGGSSETPQRFTMPPKGSRRKLWTKVDMTGLDDGDVASPAPSNGAAAHGLPSIGTPTAGPKETTKPKPKLGRPRKRPEEALKPVFTGPKKRGRPTKQMLAERGRQQLPANTAAASERMALQEQRQLPLPPAHMRTSDYKLPAWADGIYTSLNPAVRSGQAPDHPVDLTNAAPADQHRLEKVVQSSQTPFDLGRDAALATSSFVAQKKTSAPASEPTLDPLASFRAGVYGSEPSSANSPSHLGYDQPDSLPSPQAQTLRANPEQQWNGVSSLTPRTAGEVQIPGPGSITSGSAVMTPASIAPAAPDSATPGTAKKRKNAKQPPAVPAVPKKRGRPTKAMLAEREKLRKEKEDAERAAREAQAGGSPIQTDQHARLDTAMKLNVPQLHQTPPREPSAPDASAGAMEIDEQVTPAGTGAGPIVGAGVSAHGEAPGAIDHSAALETSFVARQNDFKARASPVANGGVADSARTENQPSADDSAAKGILPSLQKSDSNPPVGPIADFEPDHGPHMERRSMTDNLVAEEVLSAAQQHDSSPSLNPTTNDMATDSAPTEEQPATDNPVAQETPCRARRSSPMISGPANTGALDISKFLTTAEMGINRPDGGRAGFAVTDAGAPSTSVESAPPAAGTRPVLSSFQSADLATETIPADRQMYASTHESTIPQVEAVQEAHTEAPGQDHTSIQIEDTQTQDTQTQDTQTQDTQTQDPTILDDINEPAQAESTAHDMDGDVEGILTEDLESLPKLSRVDTGSPTKRVGNQMGMVQRQRANVILGAMKKTGGVFPGDNEMWYPFENAWRKLHGISPDRKTVSSTLNELYHDKVLKKYSFSFKYKEKTHERHIIMDYHINPSSAKVKKTQKAIIDAWPRRYLPNEVEIEDVSRDKATGITVRGPRRETFHKVDDVRVPLTSQGLVSSDPPLFKVSRSGDQGPDEFPFVLDATVSRTPAALAHSRAFDEQVQSWKDTWKEKFLDGRNKQTPKLQRNRRSTRQPGRTEIIDLSHDTESDSSESESEHSQDTPRSPRTPAKQMRFSGRLGVKTPSRATRLPKHLLKLDSASRYHHPSNIMRPSKRQRTQVNMDPASELMNWPKQTLQTTNWTFGTAGIEAVVLSEVRRPRKKSKLNELTVTAMLMHPEPQAHSPSGTFGSGGIARPLLSFINMGCKGRIRFDELDKLARDVPKNLQDALAQAESIGLHATDKTESPFYEFSHEINRISNLERVLTLSGRSTGLSDHSAFINHGLNCPHVREIQDTQVFLEEPDAQTGKKTPNRKRPDLKTHTQMDFATFYVAPDTVPFKATRIQTSSAPAPGQQSLPHILAANAPRAPLAFVRSTLNSFPGSLPRAFPENAPTRPTATFGRSAGPLSKRPYHYTSRKLKRTAEVSNLDHYTTSQELQDPDGDFQLTSKRRKYVRSGRYAKPHDDRPSLLSAKALHGQKIFVEKKVDFVDYDRLPVAVAVVKSLCGGVDDRNHWDIIAHALSFKYEPRVLSDQWRGLARQKGGGVRARRIQKAFHEPFLKAYGEGKLPGVNFNDLSATDWPALVHWVESELLPLSEEEQTTLNLPVSKKALEIDFEVAALTNSAPYNGDKLFLSAPDYGARHPEARLEAATKACFGTPLDVNTVVTDPPNAYDINESMVLAKSWARAIAMTGEKNYDDKQAAAKIKSLDEPTVTKAVDQMIQTQYIMQVKKDRQLPGRNYRLHRFTLEQFRRWPGHTDEFKFLRQVAAARTDLVKHFATHAELELEASASEAKMLVVTNLVAQRFLQPVSVLPLRNDDLDAPFPKLNLWGYSGYKYQSKGINKSAFTFPVVYRKTTKFSAMHNLVPGVPLPDMPIQVSGEPHARLPFWLDITGNLMPSVWDMALRSVLHCVVFRAGATATAIQHAHRNKLWAWEIAVVLGWMEETGLVVRVGRKKGDEVVSAEKWKGGWRVGEWWYCAFLPEIATWTPPEGVD